MDGSVSLFKNHNKKTLKRRKEFGVSDFLKWEPPPHPVQTLPYSGYVGLGYYSHKKAKTELAHRRPSGPTASEGVLRIWAQTGGRMSDAL